MFRYVVTLAATLLLSSACDQKGLLDANKDKDKETSDVNALPSVQSPAPTPDVDPSTTPTGGVKLEDSLLLQDVTNIVVTPQQSENLPSSVEAESFYASNDEGQLEKINLFGSEGLGLTKPFQGYAEDVIQVGSFIIFLISSPPIYECGIVLLQKTNGKMFCLGSYTDVPSYYYANGTSGYIQSDAAGNIYFVDVSGNVVKVDLTDPEKPVKTTLFARDTSIYVLGYVVNADGDVLVYINGRSFSDWGGFIIKANGGIQNFANNISVKGFLGLDGSFYWFGSLSAEDNDIHKLAKGHDGSFTASTHAASVFSGNHPAVGTTRICQTDNEIFGGALGSSDVYSLINSPGRLDVLSEGFSSWSDIACGKEHLYVLGKDALGNGIIKSFELSSGSWSTLLAAGDFTVYNFKVNKSGKVFFTALRNSDGAKVFARIDAPGEAPKILSEKFFKPENLIPLD